MGGDSEPQFDNSAIANGGFALGKTDLDVVMIEECLVEGVDGLVDGLLGGEEQSPVIRVVGNSQPLLRSRDQIQQIGRQRLGRLDVDP